jgi:estrogen-related receptor beta like 1
MSFVVMEDLLDKLKLLNYEEEFVRELKMRPLNRHYFVLQTNPGEQFFLFTSLAAWLIRKADRRMDPPQEFDDPNMTITNILDQARQIGVAIDFAPSKLKQGYGEQAIYVLDRLADEALRVTSFQWGRPMPPQEHAEGDDEVDDEAELNLEKVEEEMAAEYSEEEEDEIFHIDELSSALKGASGGTLLPQRPEEILQSTTDAEEWNLEVERVAPQLKVTVRVDARDWRTHLEQMHNYRNGIEEALNSTKFQLDKIHTDIGRTLEKISSREKYLNSQLEVPLSDFRRLTDMLAAAREQYRQVSGGVTERSRLLSQIADELEAVKAEMEERGSSMTDGTPLVNIRKTLARMKQEVMVMDVRVGVVEHSLLQAKLKDKSNMQRDLQNHHVSSSNLNAYYT